MERAEYQRLKKREEKQKRASERLNLIKIITPIIIEIIKGMVEVFKELL